MTVPSAPEAGKSPFFQVPWRRLRSRLGLRLLGLFALCTIVPTCAVAFLSWGSVTRQLTRQGSAQLEALAQSAARQILDRLEFLAKDLADQAADVSTCTRRNRGDSNGCHDGLLYGAEHTSILQRLPDSLARLHPNPGRIGKPALVALPDSSAGSDARFYLFTRERSESSYVVVRVDRGYLWSETDEQNLPAGIHLTLAIEGTRLLGSDVEGERLRLTSPMPDSRVLETPAIRVSMSQPLAFVLQPVRLFAKWFPVLLAFALLLPVLLTIWQLRRTLAPLSELTAATKRIAQGDFVTAVTIVTGDELETLGSSFNAMTGQLDRQFRAINASSEIDRAILSATELSAIARTVLQRVPEIFPCEAVSLTVLGSEQGPGLTWIEEAGRPKEPIPAIALPANLSETNWYPSAKASELPPYLAHLASETSDSTRILAYPLRLTDELQGLFAIRVGRESLLPDALPYLHRLADQVAVALGNIRMVDQIRQLAFYDPTTALPNRTHYYRRLSNAMKHRSGSPESISVCTIDLDHFSQINGTLGPKLGDQLLCDVGYRFAESLGQTHVDPPGTGTERLAADRILFHLGADQFAVIVTGAGAAEKATATAGILLYALKAPFRLGDEEVVVNASAGIAVFPQDGTDAEGLHKNAEVSLSYAKSSGLKTGGSAVEVYVPSMGSERMSRLQLERDLRRALDRDEFRVVYQPIVDLETGKVAGAEALVRWEHPERGLLTPASFISRCEESGLILQLGDWILREVCAQIARWQATRSLPPLRISVNMSARQFVQRTVVERVERSLRDAGIDPQRLCLELTESCLMEGSEASVQKVRELVGLGVAVAVDDFGTGYSSLAYLKHFPVSALKIDRSFISGLPQDPDSVALTRAVIALGTAMDLDIVAEGVENRAQAAFLRKRGCGKAQGYLYGHALSAEKFQVEVQHPGLRAG